LSSIRICRTRAEVNQYPILQVHEKQTAYPDVSGNSHVAAFFDSNEDVVRFQGDGCDHFRELNPFWYGVDQACKQMVAGFEEEILRGREFPHQIPSAPAEDAMVGPGGLVGPECQGILRVVFEELDGSALSDGRFTPE
jgi:hypothetical protein